MPRYFFNVVDGHFLVDNVGTECRDMHEVRNQAITTAGDILRGKEALSESLEWEMHVTDSAKITVLKITFEVIEQEILSISKAPYSVKN